MPNDAINRWIIDSATDFAIIATDRRGRVTAWNEGARLILGWTEAEMLGQPVDCIFAPEDLAADRPAVKVKTALETGAGNDERWHLRNGGERFWANGEMTVLRDDAGDTLGFVKVLRDRAEQRLATERLGGGQTSIRLLLDSMIEGFYAVDTNGVTTVCNATFPRMMGFERQDDAVGRMLHDVIHGQHPDGSHYDVAAFPHVEASHRTLPFSIMFTDPPLAVPGTIGKKSDPHIVRGCANYGDQGRAEIMRRNAGTAHIYADAENGRIIGAALACPGAEHLAHLLAWAVERHQTAADLLALPIYHPTYEEGLKPAIGSAVSAPAPADDGSVPGA